MGSNVSNEHIPSIFRVKVTANGIGYIDSLHGLHERTMGGIERIEPGAGQWEWLTGM